MLPAIKGTALLILLFTPPAPIGKDCRTSQCSGTECDLTFESCFDDQTCEVTYKMTNNQWIFNSCFYVENLGMASRNLEDESTMISRFDGVKSVEAKPLTICCGDNTSHEVRKCDDCRSQTCPAGTYFEVKDFKDVGAFESEISKSSGSGLGATQHVICRSSREGSAGSYTLRYEVTNAGTGPALVNWEQTPLHSHVLGPGETVVETLADIASTEVVLSHVNVNAAELRGLAPTYVCPDVQWEIYGAGWSGSARTPDLWLMGVPIIGTDVSLVMDNSQDTSTTGFLLVGTASASIGTGLGGTLLVIPSSLVVVPLADDGLILPFEVPNNPLLDGLSLYLQELVLDPGASHGVAFTAGLEMPLRTCH